MLKFVGKVCEGIIAVAGAIVLSQAPLYMQYYSHNLAGRVAELRLQTQGMERTARLTGKNLVQYIHKFLESNDADFHAQGELMQGMVDRLNHLTGQMHALQQAAVWERPFVFMKSIQWDIAKETLKSFEPGLVFSVEGAIYALIGMGIGYLLFYCLRKSFGLLIPKKRGAPVGTLE